jgi:hypothetical protein
MKNAGLIRLMAIIAALQFLVAYGIGRTVT